MRKFIFLLTSLLVFAILSCQSEKVSETVPKTTADTVVKVANKRGPIQIYGTIQNAGNTKIKLTYQQTNRSAVIKDGKFSINHLINEPGIYQLVYNGQRIPLFLRPNDELEVNFDALKIGTTIKFSGTDPISQEYLFLKSTNNPLSYSERRKAATLAEAAFIKQTNLSKEKIILKRRIKIYQPILFFLKIQRFNITGPNNSMIINYITHFITKKQLIHLVPNS